MDDDAVPAVEAKVSHLVVTCVQCGQVVPEATDEEVAAFRASIVPVPETVEGLDRAVEEARRALLNSFEFDGNTFYGAVVAFEAAVSAKARAEEGERLERINRIATAAVAHLVTDILLKEKLREIAEISSGRARSSEEANG